MVTIEEQLAKAERERDEALSRMEDLEADVRYYEDRWERIIGGAYIRGAEAMRLACQQWCRAWENDGEEIADALADLRVEDKP